jgi:ribosomal protein S18 acetylase RimI-like enzyme
MTTPPDNVLVRHPTIHDIGALLSFIHKYEQATFGSIGTSEAEIYDGWRRAGFDLSKDAWLVVNREQDIIGYARVWHYQYVHMYTQIIVFPIEYAQKVKPFLLDQVEQRALQWKAVAPSGSTSTIRIVVNDNRDVNQQLLTAAGYRRVKSRYRMEILLAAPLTPACWPAGITVRSTTIEQDIKQIFVLQDVAFAHSDGYPVLTLEEWKRATLPQEGFDPTLWFVASAQEQIIGICLCFREHDDGIIGTLAVHPSQRQKGLGQALLLHSFDQFLKRGIKQVRLYVDPEIASTAVRLYQRVGMRITDVTYQYAKEL